MGDNAPQGDGVERKKEGLEIKSRPSESHWNSWGSALCGERHNRQTNHLKEEKNFLGDISCPLLIRLRCYYRAEACCWLNRASTRQKSATSQHVVRSAVPLLWAETHWHTHTHSLSKQTFADKLTATVTRKQGVEYQCYFTLISRCWLLQIISSAEAQH